MTPQTILAALAIWFLGSIPLALLLGNAMYVGSEPVRQPSPPTTRRR